MGAKLLLLLAVAYELPDLGQIPPPDAGRAARIESALKNLRSGEHVDAAVRDLALCGEVALPAIVKRLNEAEAGERLLLLAAASPMARAAPLLAQAREDPHRAVRAWARGAPREPDPPLRDLAERYLDLLAVVEQRLYEKADDDLKALGDPLSRRPTTLEVERRRMQEKRIAEETRGERSRAALRFARAGACALASGELKPDLKDAVFVAFTGLLREEDDPAYFAAVALVACGEAAAPALEQLLGQETHEPKKIARLLSAVRADRGRGLFLSFERRRPDAKLALLDIAPDVLEKPELLDLLDHAALEENDAVRAAALDGLLDLPAPAGRDVARALLDPERYGPAEFRRAAELLARSGDLEQLAHFATLPPVPAGPYGDSQRLSNLRAAAQTALRAASGDEVEAMGRRFLDAEAKGVRTLGIDLVRDRDVLLEQARAEPADDLARASILRVLSLHPDTADAALDLLHARGLEADIPVLQRLVVAGRIDLIVALAATEDSALGALSNLPAIDPRYEEALLKIHDAAAPGRKRDALAALVALGSEEARLRCEADPDLALEVLRQRADGGFKIRFAFPLRRFLRGADGTRLRHLARVAEGLPSLEPGFFFELYLAWGGVEGAGTEEGTESERARIFESLVRTDDKTSARLFLDLLVAGGMKEPWAASGTLMVAAKILEAEDLARLLPLLREQVKQERPRNDKDPPPWGNLRMVLLCRGFNALGYARVEEALADLCDVVLDPTLQPAAFDWKHASWAPYWALDALRDFPVEAVDSAFRRALDRAEADGRLAACDPDDLDYLITVCRTGAPSLDGSPSEWWTRGRALYEVALALCDTLERLPGGDAAYGRMVALGGLNRFADAAEAARVAAARRRAAGFTALDGYVTPEYLDARARLYDALGARDAKAILAAVQASGDPFVWNLAAWYLRFLVPDVGLAEQAGEGAVRRSAGLHRMYRDTLASVRNLQGRPDEALRLLDPRERVPARRPVGNLWHEAFFAHAYLQLGDEAAARHALERAARDRRVLPQIRVDPAFARFPEVFREAEENFFYDVLFGRDW